MVKQFINNLKANMKNITQKIISVLFMMILFSVSFCDVTSSITSLVGRNAEGYLEPLGTMMGSGMNSGFYRKASPHKILGFDFTLDFVYSMAPAGQTTYNFYIPDDSISFPFQFQFPKNLIHDDISLIPTATGSNNDALYQDQTITFGLAVKDLLNSGNSNLRAQNVLGNDSSMVLEFTLNKAIPSILDQVIDNSWEIAKDIPGIGTGGSIGPLSVPPLYADRDAFGSQYEDSLIALITTGLEGMEMPELPIPGGFGNKFESLPVAIGLPIPIFQASFGLPYNTEITARGFPSAIPIGLGTVKYGGFGGKIGISEYLSDILYKPTIQPYSISKLIYIIDAPSSQINSSDVDDAISDLRIQDIDVYEIDSLNYLFSQGDTSVVIEIQNHIRDMKIKFDKQAKKKKFPIDLALGYYSNDLELDFTGASINSTNRMFSLQAGKTLNLPAFLSFMGGVGIYGGVGIESSDLNIGYELENPLAYGCFSGSTYLEETSEDDCTGSKTWTTGVPTNISLSFPGDNTFRSLIGARMRILFVDAYVDYNMGNSNNSLNAGFGITFR